MMDIVKMVKFIAEKNGYKKALSLKSSNCWKNKHITINVVYTPYAQSNELYKDFNSLYCLRVDNKETLEILIYPLDTKPFMDDFKIVKEIIEQAIDYV